MIDDQINVPLCKKLEAGSFWQNHTEQGVCLFQTALLTTAHGITIINMRALDASDTYFQSIRIAELRASICQDIFENREKLIGSHTLFQAVKYKAHSACCTTVDEKSKEAVAIVNDENSSLAIGKKGQNVKLASRLTKYKIAIKKVGELDEE